MQEMVHSIAMLVVLFLFCLGRGESDEHNEALAMISSAGEVATTTPPPLDEPVVIPFSLKDDEHFDDTSPTPPKTHVKRSVAETYGAEESPNPSLGATEQAIAENSALFERSALLHEKRLAARKARLSKWGTSLSRLAHRLSSKSEARLAALSHRMDISWDNVLPEDDRLSPDALFGRKEKKKQKKQKKQVTATTEATTTETMEATETTETTEATSATVPAVTRKPWEVQFEPPAPLVRRRARRVERRRPRAPVYYPPQQRRSLWRQRPKRGYSARRRTQ